MPKTDPILDRLRADIAKHIDEIELVTGNEVDCVTIRRHHIDWIVEVDCNRPIANWCA